MVKDLFIFVSGAAVGGALTYFFFKTKIEAKYQEMYEKDKEGFERMAKQLENDCMAASINLNKEDRKKANDIIENEHYNEESDIEEEVKELGKTDFSKIIKPEEFDEFCDDDDWNEPISLYITCDGVVFDDDENEVEDPDLLLVPNIESHFGEYERDCVYVRNFETRTDYEILRSLKTWKEVEAHREKMKADAER